MNLSKNSSNLIRILSDSPEKLEKINFLNNEEKIYNYIKDEIISNFTKEDFDEFKRALSELDKIYNKNTMKLENDISLDKVSGGFSSDDFLDFGSSYLKGYNNGKVKSVFSIVNKLLPLFAKNIKATLDKEKN